jgi:hypothetical protein
MKQLFLSIALLFVALQAMAQPCASVENNVLCADAPVTTEQLVSAPFNTGLFQLFNDKFLQLSYWNHSKWCP